MRCEKTTRPLGFTLIELMIVVLVMLVIAGFAIPNILSFIHMAKLRGSATDYSSLLQVARLRSVQDNRFYSSFILAGSPRQAYVDLKSNGGVRIDLGDPLIPISAEVSPIAAGGAPNTANLKGQFLPAGSGLVVKDGSSAATPVIFSPRGLPCTIQSALGGTVCNSAAGATAFWTFFQNIRNSAWESVTVSPAGRVQKWQYSGSAWSKL